MDYKKAGVDIEAKIASYSLSNDTHSVKINGSTKTIAASGTVDLGNYLPHMLYHKVYPGNILLFYFQAILDDAYYSFYEYSVLFYKVRKV